MRNKINDNWKNILIVLIPILAIMSVITMGLIPMAELNKWDLAISIGAMVTVLVYLVKDKGRR